MEEVKVEAHVLCVGGGIAGLMAAIRASELGARVIVVEKENTIHSSAGGAGMVEASLVRAWLEKSFDIVKLWDSWGIPMKYNGKYEFAGQGYPGGTTMGLHYQGQDRSQY